MAEIEIRNAEIETTEKGLRACSTIIVTRTGKVYEHVCSPVLTWERIGKAAADVGMELRRAEKRGERWWHRVFGRKKKNG